MQFRRHSVDSADGGPLIQKSALNLLGPPAWFLQVQDGMADGERGA
jgi:hypothetical protein